MTFTSWLKEILGTDAWVVASRMTPALSQKYQVAVSQKRFTELKAQFRVSQAA